MHTSRWLRRGVDVVVLVLVSRGLPPHTGSLCHCLVGGIFVHTHTPFTLSRSVGWELLL
jgi:hypothetical protein